MLWDFVDLKKKWATFGAMSNEEWDAIKSAATKLDWYMSDKDWKNELNTIRSTYNIAANRAKQDWLKNTAASNLWGVSSTSLTTPTVWTTNRWSIFTSTR